MTKQLTHPLNVVPQQHFVKHERERRLDQTARQFDRVIRRELRRLGIALWGVDHLLGIIPMSRHRVRFERSAASCTWSVEHDIPPDDLHRCAVYQVQLRLDDCDALVIIARSQERAHRVAPPITENLQVVLTEVAREAPLITVRNAGEADD